jgi:hypothetical protein
MGSDIGVAPLRIRGAVGDGGSDEYGVGGQKENCDEEIYLQVPQCNP